jgi:diguanylate cyclase (GGDEF)-like protein
MGENRRSRLQLLLAGGFFYAAVFSALALLHVQAIAIGAYFVIPTALVAIAGGPVAGAGGAIFSMLFVVAAAYANPDYAEWTLPSAAMSGRAIALLCTGVLVGLFAARNRALVAELRLGAERDHLTGLGNTRFYEAAVDRRLAAGQTFALLLCDMDRLKDVNDGHGHSAGDEALRSLAHNLRRLARSDDEIARIGGDEFCLVANLRSLDQAGSLANRVEAGLAAAGCPATLGWAVHPVDGRSQAELFKVADERLYARKASRARRLSAVPAAS